VYMVPTPSESVYMVSTHSESVYMVPTPSESVYMVQTPFNKNSYDMKVKSQTGGLCCMTICVVLCQVLHFIA